MLSLKQAVNVTEAFFFFFFFIQNSLLSTFHHAATLGALGWTSKAVPLPQTGCMQVTGSGRWLCRGFVGSASSPGKWMKRGERRRGVHIHCQSQSQHEQRSYESKRESNVILLCGNSLWRYICMHNAKRHNILADFFASCDIMQWCAVNSLSYVCFDLIEEQLCPWGILTFQSMLIAQACWKELQPPSCHDRMSRVLVTFEMCG